MATHGENKYSSKKMTALVLAREFSKIGDLLLDLNRSNNYIDVFMTLMSYIPYVGNFTTILDYSASGNKQIVEAEQENKIANRLNLTFKCAIIKFKVQC